MAHDSACSPCITASMHLAQSMKVDRLTITREQRELPVVSSITTRMLAYDQAVLVNTCTKGSEQQHGPHTASLVGSLGRMGASESSLGSHCHPSSTIAPSCTYPSQIQVQKNKRTRRLDCGEPLEVHQHCACCSHDEFDHESHCLHPAEHAPQPIILKILSYLQHSLSSKFVCPSTSIKQTLVCVPQHVCMQQCMHGA